MPPLQLAGMMFIGMMALGSAMGLLWLTFHVKPPGFGGVPMEAPEETREE
jgi:hypothetical protein